MVLYSNLYEREGNDSWLKDFIQIHHNDMGFYVEHKKHWQGWGGDIKETNSLDLDIDDIEKSQQLLDDFLDEHNLEDGIKVNLQELLNGRHYTPY